MAAHKLTAAQQIIESAQRVMVREASEKIFLSNLRAALDIWCWTEDLNIDMYIALDRFVEKGDVAAIKNMFERWLPVFEKEWTDLGMPRTREEWNKNLTSREETK